MQIADCGLNGSSGCARVRTDENSHAARGLFGRVAPLSSLFLLFSLSPLLPLFAVVTLAFCSGCKDRDKDNRSTVAVVVPKAPAWARAAVSPHPKPDPAKKVRHDDIPPADNTRCYVCHLPFEEETLVITHAKVGITCSKCHGDCDDHCQDENHATPPDILYPVSKIAEACWKCHPGVKRTADFVAPAGADLKKGCTECHFSHKLDRRTRLWDRETKALLK
ncbi:MAG TPA: hypothetical protein VGP72_25920 [Planctomycetota bacterium]